LKVHLVNSRRISLLKGISWRIIGSLDTVLLSFLFTGNFEKAVQIGGIELFTKVFLYYFHDRAWLYFHIGKKKVLLEGSHVIYEDKHWRSLAKSISWRIIGTIDTMIIAFFITGRFNTAFKIGITEVFTKMLLFYFHERVWTAITKKIIKTV